MGDVIQAFIPRIHKTFTLCGFLCWVGVCDTVKDAPLDICGGGGVPRVLLLANFFFRPTSARNQYFFWGDCLCSEGSMFRRFYVQKIFVQKVLCSEGSIFRRFYVQKVLWSEGPIFKRSYVQKVLCSENICSKGPIFRRFYVQKVLYSDIFRRSYIQKILCLM